MKKIISLFQRNYDGDRLVRNEVVPGAEWVIAGEGVATRKYDGTCCLIRDGKLYKRYERSLKMVANDKTPPGWEPVAEVDVETGKQQGWVPVGDGPEDRWYREAMSNWKQAASAEGYPGLAMPNGTLELVGPKVQGNPEGYTQHDFIYHDCAQQLFDCPRDFDGIKAYLAANDIEGIVWHHPDGRMVKIKGKDFGLKRKKAGAVPA